MTENTLATTLLSPMIFAETALGMVLRVMAEPPKICFADPGMLMAAGLALGVRIYPFKSSRVAGGLNACGRDRYAKGAQ
jgi:hypothetical protein